MKIALDYDGTVTEDPESWVWFVKMFRHAGHDVRIVTFRQQEDLTSDMLDFQRLTETVDVDAFSYPRIPLIFTARTPKSDYCKSIGWIPDVWIDDNPELILHATEWTTEQYKEWQETVSDRLVAKPDGAESGTVVEDGPSGVGNL